MNALIGKKRGMTQIWRDDGTRVPVTVIEVEPNKITAIKTLERDGYEAVQLGYGSRRPKTVAKAQLGVYSRLGLAMPCRYVREVRGPAGELAVGQDLTCEMFAVGGLVDVIGTSKGKGFAGTIKRHGFARGPVSHGSQNVRRPGSIGMNRYPHRVFRGKKMAGRMGNEQVTVKGLEVIAVDAEAGHMLVKGPVPGANGGVLMIRRSHFHKDA